MPERDHRSGCPAVMHPERPARVETFVLDKPPQIAPETGHVVGPGRPVRVTRCADCGESFYEDVTEEEAAR